MKTRHILYWGLFILICLVGCTKSKKQANIVGTWSSIDNKYVSSLSFYEDGTLDNVIGFHKVDTSYSPNAPYAYSPRADFIDAEYEGAFSNYKTNKDTLSLFNLVTREWDTLFYTIQGDTLIITPKNNETQMIYERIKSSGKKSKTELMYDYITLYESGLPRRNSDFFVSVNKKGEVFSCNRNKNDSTLYCHSTLTDREIQRFNILLEAIDVDSMLPIITNHINDTIIPTKSNKDEIPPPPPIFPWRHQISFVKNNEVKTKLTLRGPVVFLLYALKYNIDYIPDYKYYSNTKNSLVSNLSKLTYRSNFSFMTEERAYESKKEYQKARDKRDTQDIKFRVYSSLGDSFLIDEPSDMYTLLNSLYYAPSLKNIQFDEKYIFKDKDLQAEEYIYTDGRYFRYKDEIRDIGYNYFDLKRTESNIYETYIQQNRNTIFCY